MSIARRLAALTGTSDPDVAAWLLAARANGGFYTAQDVALATAFVAADKASGVWYLTDDIRVHWVSNQVLALTSLKKRILGSAVSSPVHTPNRDFTTNGLSSFINSNFSPSADAQAMTINSAHLESWERTNVSASASPIGAISGSNQINAYSRSAGNVLVSVLGGGAVFTLGVATSVGLTQTGRNGATLNDVYAAKNGVDLTRTSAYATLATALPASSFYIGGANSSGSLSQAKAAAIGWVAWGAALSGAQRLARSNAVQAWATGAGAA